MSTPPTTTGAAALTLLLALGTAGALTATMRPVGAQHTAAAGSPLRVELDVAVSPESADGPRIEPHLAVNPEDPDHLVGAAVELADPITIATFTSGNGGATWSRTVIPDCWLDPWVGFLPDGRVALTCIDRQDRPGILIHLSEDGGRSWAEPTPVPFVEGELPGSETIDRVGSYDHEAFVAGRDRAATLYLVAMQAVRTVAGEDRAGPIFLALPLDGAAGVSATSGVARRFIHGNVWANTLNPLLLGADSVGFAYVDFAVAEGNAVAPLRTRRAWWVRSDDAGHSFGAPRLIAELQGASTLPLVATGPTSAPHAGHVYLAVDERLDGRSGIRVHRSIDRGDSWTAGPWLTRAGETGPFGNPAVAVDSSGAVAVAWYDGSSSRDGCHQLRFAASSDGGEQFTGPITVRPGSCPGAGAGDRRPRWPWGGDYFGLAGLPDGGFQLLWSHAETGRYDLRTARVRPAL